MNLTKNQKITLFSIGEFYSNFNYSLSGKPLEISVSKIGFIHILLESSLSKKSERTIYYNLKELEEKKLITYTEKSIALTRKGVKLYKKITKELEPFLAIKDKLNKELKPHEKLQTKFKV